MDTVARTLKLSLVSLADVPSEEVKGRNDGSEEGLDKEHVEESERLVLDDDHIDYVGDDEDDIEAEKAGHNRFNVPSGLFRRLIVAALLAECEDRKEFV